MRIYEQIETSLSELEEDHTKLTEESAWEKAKIKRCVTRDNLTVYSKTFDFQFERHSGGSGDKMRGASETSGGGRDQDAGQKGEAKIFPVN